MQSVSTWAACAVGLAVLAGAAMPPPGFTVAFIGDQGSGPDAEAVLQLIADEGADAVVHAGDFDYGDDPAAWDQTISDVLGPCYPYFAAAGNHDEAAWDGPGGYQAFLEARMDCLGLSWDGDLGVASTHTYAGIAFVLTAPGVFGDGDAEYAPYIAGQLAATDAAWRVSCWHKNMEAMQVGGKTDETGWQVYEQSRRGGAIIATGHEHSYSRTHPLRDCSIQLVESSAGTFSIARDDPRTPLDEGVSFVFVNGLGGRNIRDQQRCLPTAPPYGCNGEWASIYAQQQGADFGALFGVFHVQGDPRLAHFYFKDISGAVIDEFWVRITWGPCCPADLDGDCALTVVDLLELLAQWGGDPGGPPDYDDNGVVDVLDLLFFLSDWPVCS